jgi:hypothetical protein
MVAIRPSPTSRTQKYFISSLIHRICRFSWMIFINISTPFLVISPYKDNPVLARSLLGFHKYWYIYTELFFYIFASFVMRDLDPMVSSKVKILEGWELSFRKQSLSKQNFEEV